jgi:hypothetical protein
LRKKEEKILAGAGAETPDCRLVQMESQLVVPVVEKQSFL